jgi:serine/threonine protein kinase
MLTAHNVCWQHSYNLAHPALSSRAPCPGNNELDQIQKIHAIIGTPPAELLAKLKKRSTHSSTFDFPPCEGSGLAKMLSHVPSDCADLISKLLAYNPDERLSARQALRHPYFRCGACDCRKLCKAHYVA